MDKKEIARELGRAGGLKTKAKYGTEHYRKMINKRWEKERKKKTLDNIQPLEVE